MLREDDFAAFVKSIATFRDEALVTVTRTSMTATVVDPAHAALLRVAIPCTLGDGIDTFSFALDCKRITEALYPGNVPEGLGRVVLHVTPANLKVRFAGRVSIETLRGRFSLDCPGHVEVPKVPTLDVISEARLALVQLQDALRIASNVNGCVTIEAHANRALTITAEGGPVEYVATLPDAALCGQDRAHYSLDYLHTILTCASHFGAPTVNLEWRTDFPIRVSFTTRDGRSMLALLACYTTS